jgi:hypothetical protein
MPAEDLDRRLAQDVADAELAHVAERYATVVGMALARDSDQAHSPARAAGCRRPRTPTARRTGMLMRRSGTETAAVVRDHRGTTGLAGAYRHHAQRRHQGGGVLRGIGLPLVAGDKDEEQHDPHHGHDDQHPGRRAGWQRTTPRDPVRWEGWWRADHAVCRRRCSTTRAPGRA